MHSLQYNFLNFVIDKVWGSRCGGREFAGCGGSYLPTKDAYDKGGILASEWF